MSALEVSMMKRIGELNAEIKLLKAELTDCKAEADRLKAEVERLRAASFVTAVPSDDYEKLKADVRNCYTAIRVKDEEKARLKAEAERSTAQYNGIIDTQLKVIDELKADFERLKEGYECLDKMHEKEMARSAYLCEQVERLRKAGDAVCESPYLWETDPSVIEWRAAKEGKPSV